MLLRFLRNDLAEEVPGDIMRMFNHKDTKKR
jgi:hypothetical protein